MLGPSDLPSTSGSISQGNAVVEITGSSAVTAGIRCSGNFAGGATIAAVPVTRQS